MSHGETTPDGVRPIKVRYPEGPVEAVVEADALDAALDVDTVLVRGPLFGVVAQDAGEEQRWRVVIAVQDGFPQLARDGLNSLLWFRAKDEAKDVMERRALLAAVARLESERVDELTVLRTRYRVVRAEEYTGLGPDGIEQPRPTDYEPAVPNWDRGARDARIDDGLVLDPDAPITPLQAAERLALRDLGYAGGRFPEDVRGDSRRALTTHPDVMPLPPVFRIVEQDGQGWKASGGPHATAHDARKSLDFALTWLEPRRRGLIPWDCDDRTVDARAIAAQGTDPAAGELTEYAQAADRLRTERANQLEAGGTVYRICRARRLLRWGPDGPEGPRPSDTDGHPPAQIHPYLDEDGNVHYDDDANED
ncbi:MULTISPECIES: DUF5954 family protein [Streptomyces]|uniref:DUF5954 family protein n=1 Tax=Streptomyces TaxID=1883 RepID=UPI00163B9A4C|nr:MULTISPECIES: DUF5954 family protein [Streptomyces]MBC2876437.1 hypothetical protein [Streptomyces sp. TYQ1024]UBI40893.1 DUF5954 family protein [Streptomyces mobaraensis]